MARGSAAARFTALLSGMELALAPGIPLCSFIASPPNVREIMVLV
ncbi:MAG: hypothetical protein WAO41_02095 [Candidatus Nanopelagicales bacterium]